LLSGEEEPALPVVHATRFCVVCALFCEVFCWFFQPVSFLLQKMFGPRGKKFRPFKQLVMVQYSTFVFGQNSIERNNPICLLLVFFDKD
jgi:hypothetical protein